MRDGEFFDYADFGLRAVHVEVWRGFIFVNLASEPPAPLAPTLEEHATSLLPLEPETMKVAAVGVDEFEANWKLANENFFECYHCPGQHPELCKVNEVVSGEPFSTLEEEISREGHYYMSGYWDFRPGANSWSRDGQFVSSKLLGVYGRGVEWDRKVRYFQLYPAASAFVFGADHGTVQEVRPVSPTRTQFINNWFVHEDAVEGVDYDLDELRFMRTVTNCQDVRLCEGAQRGVNSRGYESGPYSVAREPGLQMVLHAYLTRMGEGE
jgi:Rieske 2Fe-2S family protein